MAFRCLSFRRTDWYLTPSLMHGSDRLLLVQCFQELSDPVTSSRQAFSPAKPSFRRWWWQSSLYGRGEASLPPSVIPACYGELGERNCRVLENQISALIMTVPAAEGTLLDGSQPSVAGLALNFRRGWVLAGLNSVSQFFHLLPKAGQFL